MTNLPIGEYDEEVIEENRSKRARPYPILSGALEGLAGRSFT